MQAVDWITNDAGHPTTLVYDRRMTQTHRRQAGRTASMGMLAMFFAGLVSLATHPALLAAGVLAFVVAVFTGSAQGSAQLWYRRLTIEGQTLKVEWARRRGDPAARETPSAEAILDTREERMLFAAPAAQRIPFTAIQSVEQVDQSLVIRVQGAVGIGISLTDVLPDERDRLVKTLREASDRAREASEPVQGAAIAALQGLRSNKILDV